MWTHSVSVDTSAGETALAVVDHSSELALERAEQGAWSSDPSVNATTTRALCWRALFLLGALQRTPAGSDGTPQPGNPAAPSSAYVDADHAAMGRGLVDPLGYLGSMRWQGGAPPLDSFANFHTTDGEDAAQDPSGGDAGALPLLVVGVLVVGGVAALAVLTAGICYLGQRAPDVIDRELARDSATKAKTAAMMAGHASVVRLVELHLSAEEKAGHALPLDDAEKAALGAVTGQMQELGRAIGKPPPEVPLAPPSSPLPSGGQTTAMLTTLGLAAIAGYFLVQYFERRGAGA
jgi:hypothetical protein